MLVLLTEWCEVLSIRDLMFPVPLSVRNRGLTMAGRCGGVVLVLLVGGGLGV